MPLVGCETLCVLVLGNFITCARPCATKVAYGHKANIRRSICIYTCISYIYIYIYIYIIVLFVSASFLLYPLSLIAAVVNGFPPCCGVLQNWCNPWGEKREHSVDSAIVNAMPGHDGVDQKKEHRLTNELPWSSNAGKVYFHKPWGGKREHSVDSSIVNAMP